MNLEFLRTVFDVFSRRNPRSEAPPAPVTSEFRTRIVLLCRDEIGTTGHLSEFWQEIHKRMQYRHGRAVLMASHRPSDPSIDILGFLSDCESDHFLDFVEYMFHADAFWRVRNKQGVVDQINAFFDVEDLPYFLTDYVEVEEAGSYRGSPTTYTKVGSYPRVILREHRLEHAQAIEPVLHLLSDPAFAAANSEFLDALQDYRKGDLGDCLTKCGSSFESVMKVLFAQNRWEHRQTDTAATLLNTIIARTDLDAFFTQPLMLVATMRNRLSKAHGAGLEPKDVSRHVAQFAINATAAGILLLVAEAQRHS